MEDPEVDLQGSNVELLGLKTKRSVSVTSTTTLADGSHLELHQVARDGNVEQLDLILSSVFWLNRLNELDEKDNSALHYAARYSHLEAVKRLVATAKATVDLAGSDGMTPLHYASRYGKNITERSMHGRTETEHDEGVQVVDALVQAGADLNKQDVYRLSPLHHAAMRGNIMVVKFLTQQPGVQVDIQDSQESTPLHLAATYGNTEVAKILLEAGADCKILDYQHQNPVHRAAKEGNNKIVKIIVDHLDEVDTKDIMKQMDNEKNSPLLLAVQAGNSEAVGIFMEKGGSAKYVDRSNDKGECPLHSATRSGDKTTVEILIEYGARINTMNSDNETPLFLAAENAKDLEDEVEESIDIVKFLVENGAILDKQNKDGISPIMIAACQGHGNVVQYLCEKKANLENKDRNDQTIIHLAAKNDQASVIKGLLNGNSEAHYLVNENDQYDNTPLHLACERGYLETVRELLNYGADIDNKNEDEQTPFHLAAKNGHVGVVQSLLKMDQNAIFDKDEDDNTALHLAATAKMTYTVEVLLDEGASVHEKNDNNWTPLDCAAASGAYKCAELLIENGSPLDPLDRKKTTPLHLTAIHGHQRVTQLLLNHGANVDLENDEGKNALELAIHHGNRNVTETILESTHWKKALKTSNVVIDQNGREVLDTPMRMLIRAFPDIAQKVFDKCITKKKANDKDKDKEKIKHDYLDLDYQFLDDTFNFNKHEEGDNLYFEYKEEKERDMKKPYDSNGTTIMENHPLMLMVKHKHKHLLKHPLCIGLLRHKWKKFGRFVFYFQFLLYSLFLASITSYVLLKMEGRKNESSYFSNMNEVPEKVKATTAVTVSRYSVIVLGLMGIFIELLEILRMRSDYFSFSNLVDWGLYALAAIFVMNFDIPYHTEGCGNDRCWQWPVGSFLLTCSWLNLLVYFRQLPLFGIFIIMFTDILKTVAKFSVVLSVFLIAFGLGFHIVFVNQDAFDNPGWALIKTFVMMIGEFEFEGIFTEEHNSFRDPFPVYSSILFIVFVLVMSIIIMNLLVGLAVDDIKEIQENAELEKLSMHVKLVLELERFFPDLQLCLSRRFLDDYSRQTERIVARKGKFFKLKDVLSKVSIWSNLESRDEGGDDGTIDRIAENQRELGKIVRGLTNQLDLLMEETSELKDMVVKLETKDVKLRKGGAKFHGSKIITNFDGSKM